MIHFSCGAVSHAHKMFSYQQWLRKWIHRIFEMGARKSGSLLPVFAVIWSTSCSPTHRALLGGVGTLASLHDSLRELGRDQGTSVTHSAWIAPLPRKYGRSGLVLYPPGQHQAEFSHAKKSNAELSNIEIVFSFFFFRFGIHVTKTRNKQTNKKTPWDGPRN